MSDAEKVLFVLRRARELVAAGWCQNDFFVGGRRCCADGALLASCGMSPGDALGVAEPTGLHIWNDAPGRTQAEVVALFDRAIELAEMRCLNRVVLGRSKSEQRRLAVQLGVKL